MTRQIWPFLWQMKWKLYFSMKKATGYTRYSGPFKFSLVSLFLWCDQSSEIWKLVMGHWKRFRACLSTPLTFSNTRLSFVDHRIDFEKEIQEKQFTVFKRSIVLTHVIGAVRKLSNLLNLQILVSINSISAQIVDKNKIFQ